MVLHKYGDRLYNGVAQVLTRQLRAVAARVEAAHGESFLKELKARWDDHIKSTQMIRDILMVRARAGERAGGWPLQSWGGCGVGLVVERAATFAVDTGL